MQKELVSEIEQKINVEIAAARDVRVKILPRAEAFAIPDLIRMGHALAKEVSIDHFRLDHFGQFYQ